jgi:hypothetical protein
VVLRNLALCRTLYPLRSGRPTVTQGVSAWIVTYCCIGIEWVAQVSILRPGFPDQGHCEEKPRSQNRDLGHPLNGENISKKCPLTADLSTALRFVEMTKGRAVLPGGVVAEQEPCRHQVLVERTAGPSTALRSGRDDKGE